VKVPEFRGAFSASIDPGALGSYVCPVLDNGGAAKAQLLTLQILEPRWKDGSRRTNRRT
jgi:hypothetical protein